MFQRFASALFGDEGPPSRGGGPGDDKEEEEEEEEEEEWILVNYLAEARCVSLPGSSASPQEEEEEDEEEDLVMIPSLRASPIRYASCTSLNSTAGLEEEEEDEEEDEEEEEEGGFQRLDACSMEESWFVTPPPCFTGRGSLLESSPLENLLIEHPSMSVYGPPRARLDPRAPPAITSSITSVSSRGKKKGRRALDGQRHRPEVAVVPRRSSLHSACYARAGLLQPWVGNPAQRTQQLSRNALRRLNLLRPPKTPQHLHQPSQRHLNF